MKFVCTLEDGKLAGGDAVCSVCTFFSFHFKGKGWRWGIAFTSSFIIPCSILDIRFFVMGNGGMDCFVRNDACSARLSLYIGRPDGAYSFYLFFYY